MLLAFVSCTALFGGTALLLPPSYKAESVMMIRLGSEYLVNADPANTAAYPENRNILASEVAMLTAPEIITQVIRQVGLNRLYPALAEDVDPNDPQSEHDAQERALLKFSKHLTALPGKESTLMTVTFANANPEVAGKSLELLVNNYLESRRKHFEYANGAALSDELGVARHRLDDVAQRLDTFKESTHIVDYVQQVTGLFQERELVTSGEQQASSDIATQKAQIASLEEGLEQIGASVLLRTDSSESDAARAVKVAAAQLRLKANELRIAFKDGSPQLDDISRQIGLTQSLNLTSGQDQSVTSVIGRPVAYDTVLGSLRQAMAAQAGNEARLSVLSDRRGVIDQLLRRYDSKRTTLEQLQRELKVAEDAYFQAGKRVTEARAHDQMMEVTKPNVEVVQAARTPFQETWTRIIIGGMGLVLGVMLAATLAYVDELGRSRKTAI